MFLSLLCTRITFTRLENRYDMWNKLTILWNDVTIDWNDLTMEQNDRKSVWTRSGTRTL